MATIRDALSALKGVVLIQERIDRMQGDIDRMAGNLSDLKDFTHNLDKRLYALERIIDLGAQASRTKRIEES